MLAAGVGAPIALFFASEAYVVQLYFHGGTPIPQAFTVSAACVLFWALAAVPVVRLERRFPISVQKAREWYDSPAYAALRPLRQKATKSRIFVAEGIAGN